MVASVCSRSIKKVEERLDRLISKIHEIQRPYMNGEIPADLLLVYVTSHIHLASIEWTFMPTGRTWTDPPCVCKEVVEMSCGFSIGNDVTT